MDWLMGKSKAKPNGKKPAAEEKKVYLEPEYAKSRITDFGFKELVVLPREIDLNEWLASNTTTFFHHVNLQYSTISEFCTGEACQTMAVCNTQYYWYDERGKKVKCTAPQYVDFVMSSVQKLVTDEDVFPTKYGACPRPAPPRPRPRPLEALRPEPPRQHLAHGRYHRPGPSSAARAPSALGAGPASAGSRAPGPRGARPSGESAHRRDPARRPVTRALQAGAQGGLRRGEGDRPRSGAGVVTRPPRRPRVPQLLRGPGEEDLQVPVPCAGAYLLGALQGDAGARAARTLEHALRALHPLRPRVQPARPQRDGGHGRPDGGAVRRGRRGRAGRGSGRTEPRQGEVSPAAPARVRVCARTDCGRPDSGVGPENLGLRSSVADTSGAARLRLPLGSAPPGLPRPPRPRLGLGLRGDTQRGGGPSPRRGPQASLLPPIVLARAGVAFRDPGLAFSLRPIWTLAQGRLEGRGGRVSGAPRAAMSPSAVLTAQEGNGAGQAPGCGALRGGLCGAAAGGRRAWFPCAGVIKRLLSGQLLCVSSASRRSVLWRPGHAPCSSHGLGQRPPLHASPRSSH